MCGFSAIDLVASRAFRCARELLNQGYTVMHNHQTLPTVVRNTVASRSAKVGDDARCLPLDGLEASFKVPH